MRFLIAVIPYRNIGTGFCKSFGDAETDATVCAADYGGFVLKGEQGVDAGFGGGGGVVVGEVAMGGYGWGVRGGVAHFGDL